jgi:polysaccharide biosynthesis protein VpsJ
LIRAIEDAVACIRAWGEARQWKGYDPYDGLNSPAAPVLSIGTRLGRRVITQIVKQSPLNLRRALGIKPEWNAKALGLVASAYARLWAATGDNSARLEAERWLTWLEEHHSGDASGMAWGYNFDVQTRFFSYPRGTANTIATSFVARAFLDGHELLGDERWRDSAVAAARYLEANMLTERGYFRYLAREDEFVHNANLLACAVLARAGHQSSVGEALKLSLSAQRDDGSWPYAEGPRGSWVDNFHTAYVLESLVVCEPAFPEVRGALERGLDFWERELFLPDGTPKYDVQNVYPIDAHCYASAIDAWVAAERLEQALRTASRLIARMIDPSGYVWFQKRRLWTSRVPFIRWTTAPSFCALAGVMHLRSEATSTPEDSL